MPISPKSMLEKPFDFRAPPPSPIASGRRSCVTNDDVLTEFLEHSLRVPNLVLPDRAFPKQKFIENPPKIDFQLLTFSQTQLIQEVLNAVNTIGCFQLVNYGISSEFIKSVLTIAAEIFQVPSEKQIAVTKSFEKPYGYGEGHDEEENQFAEEFIWCRDEKLKLDMERIWPVGYSNFSEKMDILMWNIEKIGEKIIQVVKENWSVGRDDKMEKQEALGSVCYVEKHKVLNECEWVKYDVIRMVIRGIDYYSHALGLHICHGSSLFHVYSKKAWFSFCPDQHSLLVTIGDQIQVMSGGQYKHVMGRPIYKAEKEDFISMAFLYSPPSRSPNQKKEKTISISQQAMLFIILTLAYHFSLYLYHNF